MAVSDPIADMLTKIRNAYRAAHETVLVRNSKINKEIAEVLERERYISKCEHYEKETEKRIPLLELTLIYDSKKMPVIHEMKKISKPGRRVYKRYRNIERVRNGFGIAIVSTSHGVLTDRQAREKKVGGELICSVW